MANYSELLKDPRWQKKRLLILERDNWKCTLCKRDNVTLHVHHKSYEYQKNPWEYDDSILITLCESCHTLEENLKHHSILTSHAKEANVTRIQIWDGINFLSYLAKYHPDKYKAFFKDFQNVCDDDVERKQLVNHAQKIINESNFIF